MIGRHITNIIQSILKKNGLRLVTTQRLASCDDADQLHERIRRLQLIDDSELRLAIDLISTSQSQLGQDLMVLSHLDWKRDGYFVEFGATDGVTLSNTAMLEKQFGWTGILAEPARIWHPALRSSGRTAHIDYDCVWSETGKHLQFSETPWAEVSTITAFRDIDIHAKSRGSARKYSVKTISFNDLLKKYDAPSMMDYLSIDTEGSELEILSSLDFARYKFQVITCEHNFTSDRSRVQTLLEKNGYVRKFVDHSDFDDWYFLTQ